MFAFGEETRWSADQATGRLDLAYADGAIVRASFEMIGSFNPADRSFLFACDNRSVDPALCATARAMKDYGAALGAAEFGGRTTLAYRNVARLVSLAHDFGDFLAIFRSVDTEHRSIFLGLAALSCHDAAGNATAPREFVGADTINGEAARRLVESYFAAMDPIEREWKRAHRRDLDAAIARKNEVYDRYWSRSDDDWRPASMGEDDFDLKKVEEWVSILKRGGGCFVLAYNASSATNTPYVVGKVGDTLRIVDCDLDWGQNALWA